MASSTKENAYWTAEDVETFCKLCVEQINKGNRPATNKRDGWTIIINKFEELRGKKYDKTKMKSKWDNLKEEWKRWRTLVYSETGLGWDPRKKTIDASDEWWESKIQANPKVKVFRMKGIPPDLEVLLDRMFRDTVATGGITWNPAQGLCVDENVDATQPNIDDAIGSTDDNLECDVGKNIDEPIQTQARKRVAQTSTRETRGKKAKNLSPAQLLGSQINRLCSAVESRSANRSADVVASRAYEEFGPYKDLISMLDAISEIVQDEKLYFFAIKHFKDRVDNRRGLHELEYRCSEGEVSQV
ncbi:L10-interacting MYB domain-containing protein-like [Eucalyptus grandis]|uniref:L10-interacting MYB domain-containing protein-like n=1 Tax=Eucalyptus grandis TaxID=71139 RepID=UPI00192EDF34|nr:L10-interacting MYB domain-containing protein-like [Eucalyptus grandis]